MTQFDCSQCLFSWLFEMTKNLSQVFVFQRVYYVQGFHQVWYQGGMKATVSGVVEDLKFKISEGSDPNWCFPDSAQLAVSAVSRKHQFWSEPSEILNIMASTTPETVAFMPP